MNSKDVKKFADLARIEMTEGDLQKMASEIDEVLKYVGQLDNAAPEKDSIIESAGIRNVFREDANPKPRGVAKEKILDSAPNRDGDYIKVKKIM